MAEESKQRVHILRLFGMEQAALVRILREAAAQGCPGLRLLEQGGEQAVCVRARSQSPEGLDLAAQWADELEKLLSSACFGRDGLGLPQAAAQTLARRARRCMTSAATAGAMPKRPPALPPAPRAPGRNPPPAWGWKPCG